MTINRSSFLKKRSASCFMSPQDFLLHQKKIAKAMAEGRKLSEQYAQETEARLKRYRRDLGFGPYERMWKLAPEEQPKTDPMYLIDIQLRCMRNLKLNGRADWHK